MLAPVHRYRLVCSGRAVDIVELRRILNGGVEHLTVQKASALLRQLYKDGADDRKVDKAKDKKVTKFSLM